jgi:hypothetical protein
VCNCKSGQGPKGCTTIEREREREEERERLSKNQRELLGATLQGWNLPEKPTKYSALVIVKNNL